MPFLAHVAYIALLTMAGLAAGLWLMDASPLWLLAAVIVRVLVGLLGTGRSDEDAEP